MATLKRFRNVVVDVTEIACVNEAGVIKFREGGTVQVGKQDAAALIMGLTSDAAELAVTSQGRVQVSHGIPTLPTQPAPEAMPPTAIPATPPLTVAPQA
jgi:hypothetical protein